MHSWLFLIPNQQELEQFKTGPAEDYRATCWLHSAHEEHWNRYWNSDMLIPQPGEIENATFYKMPKDNLPWSTMYS